MAGNYDGVRGSLLALGGAALGIYGASWLFRSAGAHWNLTDKVVAITGGSRGLGLALAREFGNHGCQIALLARDLEELEQAESELRRHGISARIFSCDVTDRQNVERAIHEVVDLFGRLDVLVNNAGEIAAAPFAAFRIEDFEQQMATMFWGPVYATYAALAHFSQRPRAHIVNITSVGGRISVPHLLPYCCAKFAAVAFSDGLAAELPDNVRVTTVVPGLMRTGSYVKAKFRGEKEKEFAWFGLLSSLPGFSVSAVHAARCVRKSVQSGRRVCTISVPAKAAIVMDALTPDLMRNVMRTASQYLLPHDIHEEERPGYELMPSLGKLFHALTTLGRHAAREYRQPFRPSPASTYSSTSAGSSTA